MRWIPIFLLVAIFGAGGAYVINDVSDAKHKGDQSIGEVTETSIEREHFETIADDALALLLVRVAKDASIPVSEIAIVSSVSTVWPNGCLGISAEGEMCTQALVEGYRVGLEAGGVAYTYRMSLDGKSIRKE